MSDKTSKIEKKTISILGCGWLGMPLAQRLIASDISSQVNGSTTSASKLSFLKDMGVVAFQLGLSPELEGREENIRDFFDCDVLIISIPPGIRRNAAGFHLRQIEAIMRRVAATSIGQILYISSTGVYPNANRVMTEQDVTSPEQSASPEMVAAENSLMAYRGDRKVGVLRFGGLLGYDRIPGKYVKGKKDLTTYDTPVNYIHQDDAVGVLMGLIERGIKNETYNAVAPIHSLRGEVYQKSCVQFGWEAPTFVKPETPEPYKMISSQKLASDLNYVFQYPDPLDFYYALNEPQGF